MIALSRAHADTLGAIFGRMATAHPNLYLALVAALREVDRAAADAVVGEDDPEMLLRRQGAARHWRSLLIVAITPVGPTRGDDRAPSAETPQL